MGQEHFCNKCCRNCDFLASRLNFLSLFDILKVALLGLLKKSRWALIVMADVLKCVNIHVYFYINLKFFLN